MDGTKRLMLVETNAVPVVSDVVDVPVVVLVLVELSLSVVPVVAKLSIFVLVVLKLLLVVFAVIVVAPRVVEDDETVGVRSEDTKLGSTRTKKNRTCQGNQQPELAV